MSANDKPHALKGPISIKKKLYIYCHYSLLESRDSMDSTEEQRSEYEIKKQNMVSLLYLEMNSVKL